MDFQKKVSIFYHSNLLFADIQVDTDILELTTHVMKSKKRKAEREIAEAARLKIVQEYDLYVDKLEYLLALATHDNL